MIRPGLRKRLAWMDKNIYAIVGCGRCVNAPWCDECKQHTLNANGGRLPSESAWDLKAKREELIAYIEKNRRADSGRT